MMAIFASRPSNVSYKCEKCSFELWLPIAQLSVSVLGLYDDARFPGRCILILAEHHENLATLAPDIAESFLNDARRVGRAISAVVAPARINYALLGNKAPHPHWHLIPRQPEEPKPTRTPWEDPRPLLALAKSRAEHLRYEIAAVLTQDGQAFRSQRSATGNA
jgi:diadenosine tetraphosphate (Ap4A) HIT family hydrolase